MADDDAKVSGQNHDTALIPIEQRQVVIEGEEVLAAWVGADDIYLPVRPLCEALGIFARSQLARIRRNEVLGKRLRLLRLETAGGPQTVQALHLEAVPLWLATIDPSRVSDEARPRLLVYLEWVRAKVWQAFATEMGWSRGATTTTTTDPSILSLAQVAEFGRALTTMAEQQIVFQHAQRQAMTEVRGVLVVQEARLEVQEQRLATQDERLNRAADVVRDINRDVKTLKSRLDPGNVITDEQAAELQETIKVIAEELTRQSIGQQKNYYASLFSELHRRFRVSSYKNLTIQKYEQALTWLQDYDAALGQASTDPLEGLP